MRGMSIVGPHDMPGIPSQTTAVQDANVIGNNFLNQGEYYKAIAQYNTALQSAPNDPLILWNRCAPYVLVGNYRAALRDITHVSRVLPTSPTILFRLAGIQTLAHEPHKALSTLRRLDSTPEVIAARDLATLIIQAEDSLGEGACYNPEFAVIAIAVAEMKIRVPLPMEWIFIRARGKFETDDLKGAEEALAKIPEDMVDSEVLLWKGKARLFRDFYLEAADLFRAAAAKDPDSKEALTYFELAVAFQAKLTANVESFGFGDKNKAVRVLSEALQTNLAHPPTKAKYLCYRAACLISLGYLTAAQLDCQSALYHVPDLARAKRIQQQAAELMAANDAALRKDYYKILGLQRGRLTDAEIKRAWREMCLKYHPDKVGNNDRARLMLQDIQAVTISLLKIKIRLISEKQAYDMLRDPEKRKEYDSGFERARRNSFDIVVFA